VAFDDRMTASLVEAAGTYCLPAAVNRQRGYGNLDEGRRHLVTSTALEADPAPGSPDEVHLFAVRYGFPGPFAPTFEHGPAGLTIRTEVFTALIGNPAGDAREEPALELRRR
jgi:hypothetical protein